MGWFTGQLLHASQAGYCTSIVQAFAWPAAAVVIVAMLRAEVRLALGRMVHLRFHDFEAQFRRDLLRTEDLAAETDVTKRLLRLPNEARRVVHELNIEGSPAAPPPADRWGADPRSIIDGAWQRLATTVRALAKPGDPDPIRTVVARGLLGGDMLLLYERLDRLHSDVFDRPTWCPPEAEARRFAELATSLADRLAPHVLVSGDGG